MEEDKFLGKTLQFPDNIKMECSAISIMGHSLGALTAVAAAAKDDRIKACCAMDIWFYPYQEDLDSIVLTDTPIMHSISDKYYTELSDARA